MQSNKNKDSEKIAICLKSQTSKHENWNYTKQKVSIVDSLQNKTTIAIILLYMLSYSHN